MEKTCKQRVREAFKSRMNDIKKLYKAGYGVEVPDIGILEQYGLCIDYVPANTFKEQPTGYWKYQISWGGPSEEFRMYASNRMEFWFLDWFDGAFIDVKDNDAKIIRAIINESKSQKHE